jgi:hypothetical protein
MNPIYPPEKIAALSSFMARLLNAGEAATGEVYEGEDIARMVCVNPRSWQRFVAGRDVPPMSVLKVYCLETGLVWEEWEPLAREARGQAPVIHLPGDAS